ncbi:predicted protein [Aspergillus terreus NIH2624]|uniref:Uncharacterized protein n=1 Tax=Aspergillus terreus (strain NIH 2624 / FGSC A1156) TaxID=341663 RepID=Q0CCW4_ASPTN|nr:uncharacterized protein ATEG_08470 [Aspergillus terreus NIH2624]EAU31643.1 predicted protein [Aspergillus terreus NIH2624]
MAIIRQRLMTVLFFLYLLRLLLCVSPKAKQREAKKPLPRFNPKKHSSVWDKFYEGVQFRDRTPYIFCVSCFQLVSGSYTGITTDNASNNISYTWENSDKTLKVSGSISRAIEKITGIRVDILSASRLQDPMELFLSDNSTCAEAPLANRELYPALG